MRVCVLHERSSEPRLSPGTACCDSACGCEFTLGQCVASSKLLFASCLHKTCLVVLGAAAAVVLHVPWMGLTSSGVVGLPLPGAWGAGVRRTSTLSVKVLDSKHPKESKETKASQK